MIQLRDKNASSSDFYRSSVEVLEIAADAGCSIIINDRVDIAFAAGAAGVHLGQDDMPAATAREILGQDSIIGLSTHSVEQVVAAHEAPIDYIAIGPIFETKTKGNRSPAIGTGGIQRARGAIGSIPLVAIGGIDRQNLTQIYAAGADSAAIISGILQDPEQITLRMQRLNRAKPQ